MNTISPSDQIFWNDVFEPVVVTTPPNYAVRDMTFCADGSIRHYGKQLVNGEVRDVYIASGDMGLSWKKFLAAPDDPGAMVKCPWADYWLTLTYGSSAAVYSTRGPGFPPDQIFETGFDHYEARPLLPLKSRKRWIVPISNVACRNGECYHAGACYSDDDGKTWTYVAISEVPNVERQFACDQRPHWFNNGCEPTIAELSDGSLLMALRTSGECVAFTRSYDGGTTWDVPQPKRGFWQANTMPELHVLKDGRLLMIWNNTAMLPTRAPSETPGLSNAELNGTWEVVFTNRDALHAAISEDDGKTWIGFREIILNEIRNDADFRELGNGTDQEHDKSVHQTQMLELPNGKILLAAGQNIASRRLILFDPAWLYEKTRTEDFRHGLHAVSHHLYVQSVSGGWRGWAGHCAWNRITGVVMAKEPEVPGEPVSSREALWLCRIDDPRLVSTRAGFVWNFPAAASGSIEIDFRMEGEGFRISLQDHWSNPSDEYLEPRSFLSVPVRPDDMAVRSHWITLRLEWDLAAGKARISCGGKMQEVRLNTENFSVFGPSYLHIQTLADGADAKGCFFRELRFAAK